MALVLDTGVIYAVLDENDQDRDACVSLLESTNEQLVIPCAVLVELDYWVRKFASVEVWAAFCEDVRDGAYAIYPIDSHSLVVAAGIQQRFSDQPIGFVDAAIVATCEALGEEKVATLDVRHFSVVRTTEGKPLHILPTA